jgi:hypothetical protein
MKTTLKITLLVLAIALPVAAFAGLVGILPTSAFSGTVFLYATFGLMVIALTDNGHPRRSVIVHPAVSTAAPFVPARPRVSYGLRRQHCPVA